MPIQPYLQNLLYPENSPAPTWPRVVVMLESRTVHTFSNCGRCLLVKFGEQHFLVRDGAHNIYTYDLLDDNEVEGITLEQITDITVQMMKLEKQYVKTINTTARSNNLTKYFALWDERNALSKTIRETN